MKFNRIFFAPALFVIMAAGLAGAACSPLSQMAKVELSTRETFLAQIDPNQWIPESYRISPDNRTFAFGNRVEGKQVIVVNGQEQKRYDETVASYLIYSPDSKHIAYPARNGSQHFMVVDGKEFGPYDEVLYARLLEYSPDSKHLAYSVKRGDGVFLVIDGVEQGPYEDFAYGISSRFNFDSMFSKDGQHYGYAAMSDNKWFAVIDGTAGPKFNMIKAVLLSKTGKRSAYIANSDNVTFMMIDNNPGKPYVELSQAIFSPDENNVAYIASTGKEHVSVINGREGIQFSDMGGLLLFSPDGQKIAFMGITDNKFFLVINEKMSGPFKNITPPVFSPDGSRFAFMADEGTGWTAYVDYVSTNYFPNMDPGSIVFSADSKRIGYIIQTQGEEHEHEHAEEPAEGGHEESSGKNRFAVVIDEKIGKEYYGIFQKTLSFSPDGKHYAYTAVDERGTFIVLDGSELGPYEGSSMPAVFSPDSRLLIYPVSANDEMYIFVNGVQGKPYAGILNLYGGNVVIDSPTSFHYIAVVDNKVYLVEETVIEKK